MKNKKGKILNITLVINFTIDYLSQVIFELFSNEHKKEKRKDS